MISTDELARLFDDRLDGLVIQADGVDAAHSYPTSG